MKTLSHEETTVLVRILAGQALASLQGPRIYFSGMVRDADLPMSFRAQLADAWVGDPRDDARRLVAWALQKQTNPNDHRYATLASLLVPRLDDLGVEDASKVFAILYANGLIRDSALRSELAARYLVPVTEPPVGEGGSSTLIGELADEVPDPDVELQRLIPQAPDLLDVGFLMRAMERSRSICRVESSGPPESAPTPWGTGFLIGRDLVLTNQHVVEAALRSSGAPDALACRFGSITGPNGEEAAGEAHALDAGEPVVASSPVAALDFAVLRLACPVGEERPSLHLDTGGLLGRGDALHLLGHPGGESMRLSLSGNGVLKVASDTGRVQYVAAATQGSSGSPAFDEEWRVRALHHAQRSRAFGTVREGILVAPIHAQISHLLA